MLAPYAMRTRAQPRPPPRRGSRTPSAPLYQRDRDRIVHCTAFRRLMYKTQVLVTQTNDHHRTRLTHTLEVAQISRTVARQLGLNEDLTEAIALSHDLGHPPFGHAGEDALDECMRDHGGFEHNLPRPAHRRGAGVPLPRLPGPEPVLGGARSEAMHSKRPRRARGPASTCGAGQPLLEAQVVDAADSLAYDTHDIDDALGVGLITLDDLDEVDVLAAGASSGSAQRHPATGGPSSSSRPSCAP